MKFMWPTRNWLPHFKFQNGVNVAEILANFKILADFEVPNSAEIDISFCFIFFF